MSFALFVRRFVPLASLTLILGCHSHPATPLAAPQPAAVPAQAPSDARPIIVCFGDSLTAGYGVDDGESYPDYLQQDLDSAGYRYQIRNEGVSGDTTQDGLNRVPHVLSLHPALVILELGGNDGLRGQPIANSQQNLATILATLNSAHIPIVLGGITLPPNYGPDYIRSFNLMYTTLSQQYGVPLLPFLLKDVYGVPGGMQPDGIHATAQGNRQVAQNLLPLIKPLLKMN